MKECKYFPLSQITVVAVLIIVFSGFLYFLLGVRSALFGLTGATGGAL